MPKIKWWMWVIIAVVIVIAALAFVQFGHTQSTPSAEQQQLVSQIQKVGCQAEENAAAQTIIQLQKENSDLKSKLAKMDPPKNGATKK